MQDNMKRFQVTTVDSTNRETPGTNNEVQLNAYKLNTQSNVNNGKITFSNIEVDSPRKFSFAQLTR